jgi:hypothetical protein
MLAGFVKLSDGSYLNLALVAHVRPHRDADGLRAKIVYIDGSLKVHAGWDAASILRALDPETFGGGPGR